MNKDEFKNLNTEQMIIAFNQLKDDYHNLFESNSKLQDKYLNLVKASEQVAFNEMNDDTELLLRCLLKQGQIQLNGGMYQRPDFDYEAENGITILGEMKTREKCFLINDDKLDEYTKQLENQLQEYTEAKKIFKKRNYKNETMINCIRRLEEDLEKAEDLIESLRDS